MLKICLREGYEMMIMPYDFCAYEKLIPGRREIVEIR